MTPNALLNLLHRGTEYLTLQDVGVLVFDECHQARKKHPYARVMAFYLELERKGMALPKVGFMCVLRLFCVFNNNKTASEWLLSWYRLVCCLF